MSRLRRPFNLVATVALSLCLHNTLSAEGGDGWALYDSKNGIQVFIRPSLNDSSLKEYRAETVVDSDLATIVSVVRDLDRQPKWVHRLESARIIDRLNESTVLIQSKYRVDQVPLLGLPKHREVIMKSEFSKNQVSGEVRFDAEVVHYNLPVDEDYRRMTQGRASWSFCNRGNEKVQVVLQAYVDLGGLLFLLDFDSLVAEAPFHTLGGLKRELAKKNTHDRANVDENRGTDRSCNNFLGH